jgi:hypothetical protein
MQGDREENEDEAGAAWTDAIARAWGDELADPRQDIYTLEDGQSVADTDETRY